MELKDTLLFPKSGFEMRGNLTQKEPVMSRNAFRNPIPLFPAVSSPGGLIRSGSTWITSATRSSGIRFMGKATANSTTRVNSYTPTN